MAKRKRIPATLEMDQDFLFAKEEMLATVQKTLQQMKFESPEEANAFLAQFIGMRMEDVTKSLRGDRSRSLGVDADALFFKAMEARTTAAMMRKLDGVLKVDPEHVRALTAVALTQSSPEAVEEGLRKAIAAGGRKLGKLLISGQGGLWGFLEARPYMEARAELAQFLAAQDGRQDEAIAEHQELLRLNENDNQGIRDPLLGLLLETRRFAEARALVKKYQTDYAATWMYGKALLEFQRHAEQARWDTSSHDGAWLEQEMKAIAAGVVPVIPKSIRAADKTLVKALKFNPWCAIYLIKASEYLGDDLPDSYSPGSEEEARLFLEHHANAWVSNPSALVWLMMTALPWLVINGYEHEIEP